MLNMKKVFAVTSVVICCLGSSLSHAAKETPFITGDIGGSTGDNNGTTYQEVHLGVNLNFTDWLTWRNSAFQRSGSKIKTITGLDSTIRLVMSTKVGQNGRASFFVGPGYRWASNSNSNAVIGEAGLGFSQGGFGLSAGAKFLKYDRDRENEDGFKLKRDDVTYFVSLSGSTSFGK